MRYLLPLFLLFPALQIQAQNNSPAHPLEAGVMLGLAGYSGDVSAKRVDLQEVRPAYGAFVRFFLNDHFALKGQVYAGAISGDDKYSEIKAPRSFQFGTSLFEVAGLFEWHLLSRQRFSPDFFFTPYAFAGAGLTFTDADALYYGPPDDRSKFLLVPLPEPGLKSRFAVPIGGGGLLFGFYERFVLGIEGGLRPTLSDDIDGVSQNGNPDENDWYFFLGLTASFVLN